MRSILKMNKMQLIAALLVAMCLLSYHSVLAWTEYKQVRYMDLDGDIQDEIIIEAKHGAGTGHYIEDMRIFKDEYPELRLIFSARTLDSYFLDKDYNYDIVSEVKFDEQTPENKGARDITVRSKKVFYKDDEHKVKGKEEALGTKTYKWNGKEYSESK